MGTAEIPTRPGKRVVNWREHIHADPTVLAGKPVVRGTRLSVDFLLRLFGNGWTVQEVMDSYPRLTPDDMQAVFAYAAECMSEEALYALPTGT